MCCLDGRERQRVCNLVEKRRRECVFSLAEIESVCNSVYLKHVHKERLALEAALRMFS